MAMFILLSFLIFLFVVHTPSHIFWGIHIHNDYVSARYYKRFLCIQILNYMLLYNCVSCIGSATPFWLMHGRILCTHYPIGMLFWNNFAAYPLLPGHMHSVHTVSLEHCAPPWASTLFSLLLIFLWPALPTGLMFHLKPSL